jgi:outer membrane protein W
MKKLFFLVTSLIFVSTACFAGNIDISMNAGIYTAPGGIGSSTMYGVAVTQPITDNVSVRAMLETTTYTANNQSVTYTPASLDIIYSQRLAGGLQPYAGVGVSYNSTTAAGATTQTTGGQAEVGVQYNFGGITAGVGYRYMIPDLNDTSMTATAFNGYMTGSMFRSISF